MSPTRAKAVAEVMRPTATLVVEDDHANEISSAELTSVGTWLPERTVHIRSFSKSHGPDLRLAAVGGAGDVVTAVGNRRLLGPGWSSRILQPVLLELIRDPSTATSSPQPPRTPSGEERYRRCSSITASTSPAPMASTCGWASTTSAPQSSPSPPRASASLLVLRSWSARHRPRPCHRGDAVARARTRRGSRPARRRRSPGDLRRRRSTAAAHR